MTDAEQLAIIKRLAEWMGWRSDSFDDGVIVYRDGSVFTFDPFTSLHDVGRLLVECKDRGLMQKVACWLYKLNPDAMSSEGSLMLRAIAVGLLATAEEITLAVLAVAEEQAKDAT